MSVQTANPQWKTGLEILRDSFFTTAALTAAAVLLSDRVTPRFVFFAAAEIAIYTFIIMFIAHSTFNRIWNVVHEQNEKTQWFVFVVVMIAISGIGSLAGSLIIQGVLGWELGQPLASLFERSFKICAVVSLMIGVNEAAWDRLKGQLEDTKSKLQKEELERERALKLATEAQLSSLEARLHPHFLFNTLNSISSLIHSDPVRAERMVERMAALLRFTLDSHEGGLVGFDQEVRIVRDYLEIEQARLGGRLRWGIEIKGDFGGLKIPPLSIQTLVENSIKYAVAPSRQGGEVRVSAEKNNGSLQVNVADTGEGFTLESAPAGHGLDNLRSRLGVLYGDSAGLKVGRADGWTTVTMKVPG
jgi:two-component system, LytTR family, sensor histidine kinase AlgZ